MIVPHVTQGELAGRKLDLRSAVVRINYRCVALSALARKKAYEQITDVAAAYVSDLFVGALDSNIVV